MNPKDYMTASERTLLAEMEAAEAAGEDVFQDNVPAAEADAAAAAAAAAPAEAPAPAPAEAAAPAEAPAPAPAEAPAPAPAAAPAEAAASAPAEPEPAPFVPPPAPIADLGAVETRIANIEAQKDALLTKFEDGEIDATVYRTQVRTLDRAIRDAEVDLTTARVSTNLRIHNENIELGALAHRSMAAKELDYSKPAISSQFDTVLSGVRANPGNQAKPFSSLVAEAHKIMLALHGKLPMPATPAPAPAPAAAAPVAPAPRPTPPAPPVTLGGLPAASIPATGQDARNALASLSGREATVAWERMTPAQQNALLGE